MKILLNAVAFVPGRMGGVETSFRNLVQALQQVDTENDYRLVCHQRHLGSFSLSNPHFSHLPCAFAKPSALWYLRVALRELTPVDLLRPWLGRLDLDLVHHPFSVLQPIGHRLPSVLTFHDMQHEFFPQYFSARALRARRALWRPSAERATRIIAISQHAKSSLVERYRIDPDKIDVVYNGYGCEFRPVRDPEALAEFCSRYGLHRPFLYYPAASWPHKNHKRLLAALKLLKERYRFDGQLVLTGIAVRPNDEVLQEVARLGLGEDVVVLGHLPLQDLPSLYSLARLMAFPSLFEGFGIPLVEAMACGCPVACSNVTSIPEVVGLAAALFDPLSVEEMAEKIWSLWSDEGLRQRLTAVGFERAQLFDWGTLARQTVETYRKAVQS